MAQTKSSLEHCDFHLTGMYVILVHSSTDDLRRPTDDLRQMTTTGDGTSATTDLLTITDSQPSPGGSDLLTTYEY
jgi:hypothetical protein